MRLTLSILFFALHAKAATTDMDQGRKVYENNCVACHGIKGDGKGPAAVAIGGAKPRDFTEGKYKYGTKPEEILKTVTNGVDGTAMPAWKSLPEQDRKAVVAYILALKKR